MTLQFRRIGMVAAACCVCALPACESGKGGGRGMDANGVSQRLRGYGTVESSFLTFKHAGVDCGLWSFEAESGEKAAVVAGKLMADLTLSPGVSKGRLEVNGVFFPLVTVEGGAAYAAIVYGRNAAIVSAPGADALKTFLTSPDGLHLYEGKKIAADLVYPKFLDRFDRYGYGFYGIDGVERDDGKNDPGEEITFCAKYDFRIELWPHPAEHDDSYDVNEWASMGWKTKEAEKMGVPLSARLYGGGIGGSLMPIRKEFTEVQQQPLPFLDGGWYHENLEYRSQPQQSWYDNRARLYMARQTQGQMRDLLRLCPDLGSWMLPYGEVGNPLWVEYHGDRSPAALRDWHESLRVKNKLGLDEVSEMFGRRENPFRSWDEVPIPEFATFAGMNGMLRSLDNNWHVRPERQPDEGLTGEWWKADVNTPEWELLDLPGDVRVHKYFRVQKWLVREFEPTPAEFATHPLYLYSFAGATNNDPRRRMPIYLNGEKLGETGTWGAWDISGLLKHGVNRVAIRSELFAGHVFLSSEAPNVSPYMTKERLRLLSIFRKWSTSEGKADSAELVLAAMRHVDPDRPIKIMAMPLGPDLAGRYGACGHSTGEGNLFFPWYKRYGYLYGIPGTSEGAGPSNDVPGQVMLYQRIFLEGLNGHDQVFTVQNITRVPELKTWLEEHVAVIKQMGRYDIAGPQVLIFRSTDSTAMSPAPIPVPEGVKSREIQSIWDWDVGRGTLQSIGQSYLYVDDGGLRDGKLDGYSILMDGGNEIVQSESLDAIEEWVSDGGTYITWPFTGRCLSDEADAWPIQRLTGCKIKTLRKPGAGSVTIGKDQTLLKEFAGKTFLDNGSSMDWQDFEHNILSVELEPDSDAEVIAKFENGEPAIVSRRLGKGRVIALGSAFFRGSRDQSGIWWPNELESAFFKDLLTGLGQPAVNSVSDPRVWAQRYRSNNGLDDVVVLVNFAEVDRTVSLNVTLDKRPTRVLRIAMNAVEQLKDFQMDDSSLTLSGIQIPKGEVQIFYFRSHDPLPAAEHWWNYQRTMWRPSTPRVHVDFTPISKGHWLPPSIDLKKDWKWSQNIPQSDEWRAAPGVDAAWHKWDMDILTAVGADPTKRVFARKTFSVPEEWLTDSGPTRLTAAGWGWAFTAGNGGWKMWLNGQPLAKPGYFNPDVSDLLRKGDNILALELEPPKQGKYIGVNGAIYLVHDKRPAKTVSLEGEWTGKLDAQPVSFVLPGQGKCVEPTRSVRIPADWKDKYVVTFYAKGKSTMGVVVDNRWPIRRHHHILGNELEVDITPYLRFGEENQLTLLYNWGDYVGKLGAPLDWDIHQLELRLYPKGDYRDE